MRCRTVCTKLEYDFLIFGSDLESCLTKVTLTVFVFVNVISGFKNLFTYCTNDRSGACKLVFAGSMRNCIYSTANFAGCGSSTCCFLIPFMLVSNNLIKPCILHLRSAAVLTDNTVNSDFVACNRLVRHCVVSYCLIPCVKTVNYEFSTVFIDNVHITVLSIINANDCTCDVVFFCCVCIGSKELTNSYSLCKCKSRVCLGKHLGATSVALEVVVFVLMTKSINLVICVCVATNRTSVSCITLCCASRISYNLVIIVTESIHGNCCSGKLYFTNCTVNYVFVRTCCCTSRINIVFNCSLTCGVTKSVNVCINVGDAASTSVSGVTLLCTSRIGYGRCVAMNVLDRRNNAFLNLAASTANAVLCAVCLFGSGSVFNPFAPSVTESINCCCLSGKFLFANCTVNYCIVRACSCAGRLNVFFNYSLTAIVTESVNCLLSNENFVTNRAVLTFSKTCALASRSNRRINNLCVTAKLAVGLAALVANC